MDNPNIVIAKGEDLVVGSPTPFGNRWGKQLIRLTPEHMVALVAGETLALDVMDEYVVFIKTV